MDATFKTTNYAIQLFFLAVKTNVDYQVVGSFAVQDETTDAISEGFSSMYGLLFDTRPSRVTLLLPSQFIIDDIFFSLGKSLIGYIFVNLISVIFLLAMD